MSQSRRILIFAAVVMMVATGSCKRLGFSAPLPKARHGGDYGMFLYTARDEGAYRTTRDAFQAWIIANHLHLCPAPVPAPGNPWPSPYAKEEWYALPGTHHIPYFRVITNDKTMWICATSNFEADLNSRDWAVQRGVELKWWLDVADWFNTNATGNMQTAGPNGAKWIVETRQAIQENFRN